MSNMDCVKKADLDSRGKLFSGRLKLTKMVKPVLKLLTRKAKTNAVTPSTCNYDVVETMQNDLNETELFQLHFKFYEEMRREEEDAALPTAEDCDDDNARNEELENRLRESVRERDLEKFGVATVAGNGEVVVEPVKTSGTYFAVPVHFVESSSGEFTWVPLPEDRTTCERNAQALQIPMLVSSAA